MSDEVRRSYRTRAQVGGSRRAVGGSTGCPAGRDTKAAEAAGRGSETEGNCITKISNGNRERWSLPSRRHDATPDQPGGAAELGDGG